MKYIGIIAAGLLVHMGINAQTVNVHKKNGEVDIYTSYVVKHIDFSERTIGHADLGLSVRWAQCNIGAISPEDYGSYFPWDGTDYAQSLLGGTWRMPTYAECQELIDNCTFQWGNLNGVAGGYFTAQNGNSIFLPASGFYRLGAELVDLGIVGNYWTTTQTGSDTAYDLEFYSGGPFMDAGGIKRGTQTIRPVCENIETEDSPSEPVVIITFTNGKTIVYEDSDIEYLNFTATNPDEKPSDSRAVDLGLPSGICWASINVGACTPEDFGDFFAWGETTANNSYYGWDVYSFGNSAASATYIGADICGTQYDVAHVRWGGTWHMPRKKDIQELVDYCESEWTTVNGITGRKFTGPNGNSIFLPAAGYFYGSEHRFQGEVGYYFTGNHHEEVNGVYLLQFDNTKMLWDNDFWYRAFGRSVRPVMGTEIPNHSNCPDSHHPHMIDLGLSSGTKWACCNVGTTEPEGCGDYFAWGETEPKDIYNWNTYMFGSSPTKYNDTDNITTIEVNDDAATVNWGGTWRMPTNDEMIELIDNCTWEWTTLDGVIGYKVTGINGNNIFLPAVGYRNETLNNNGFNAHYWTSTLISTFASRNLASNANKYGIGWSHRFWGMPIRPVSK